MWTWPWVTTALTIAVLVSPLGQSVVSSTFFSGEALANSIGSFMLMTGLAIALAAGILEWLVFRVIRRRRARAANIS